LAQDLKSEYSAAFCTYDVPTALEKIEAYVRKEICDESDRDEWSDFYYSLADFMWKKGILTEEVKQRTLQMLDDGWGLDLWEEEGASALNARKKALAKFRAQLLSPLPEKKKISKPKLHTKDIFKTGDLIAIQLQTAGKVFARPNRKRGMSDEAFQALDGKYILVQKIRCHISYSSSIVPELKDHWAIFRLFDGVYDEVPRNVDIASLQDAQFVFQVSLLKSDSSPLFLTESSMFHFRKRKYQLIGNFPESTLPYQNMEYQMVFFVGTPDSDFVSAMQSV
jgi:hypothetical protein